MKFLRPGFWQKLIVALTMLVEIALAVLVLVWLFDKANATGPTTLLYLLVAVFFLDIATSIYIVSSTSPDIYKMSWLICVWFLPGAGILMYILFANKATSRRNRERVARYARPIERNPSDKKTMEAYERDNYEASQITRYLESCTGSGIHNRTSVEYFPLVDFAFEPILRELRRAKHYIFLEFFIVAPGKMWDAMLEILKEKAKEGLDVRLIYDDLGCLSTLPMHYDQTLQSYGIKACKFNPFRPMLDIRMNNRDHRKILVIDGHTCFSGGFNLADEYINAEERFGHWKDNAILLRGEAVGNFTFMFLANWVSNGHSEETIKKEDYSPSKYIDEIGGFPESDGYVEPYGDIPFNGEAVGERVYLSLIQKAKKSIYITTPYFIIDQEMENTLCHAAKAGIDVRILTPHIPDKKAVFAVTRSFYGKLLSSGVKIYEYTPGFVHEKTFICDDDMATVGTFNLDYRSLYLHLECGTFFASVSAIAAMKRDFLDTIALSMEITRAKWDKWRLRSKWYWNLLRILGPFL